MTQRGMPRMTAKGGSAVIGKLLKAGDAYIQTMDWKQMALLKLCLCAMGVMLGLGVSRRARKPVLIGALLVFFATYVPLMQRFLPVFREKMSED